MMIPRFMLCLFSLSTNLLLSRFGTWKIKLWPIIPGWSTLLSLAEASYPGLDRVHHPRFGLVIPGRPFWQSTGIMDYPWFADRASDRDNWTRQVEVDLVIKRIVRRLG